MKADHNILEISKNDSVLPIRLSTHYTAVHGTWD